MIGIKVEKAHGEYDPGTSKFFGSPTMPEQWLSDGTIGDDDFFFCQLKLSEFKAFDKENLFPVKNGFVYFFLSETEKGFSPNVQYYEQEPETLIDDFNAGFDDLGDLETEYSIDYFEATETDDTTAILVADNDKITLLRYDPLDDNMPEFLAKTEKIAYFTITKEDLEKLDFSRVKLELK
jgi:uncharacterized protein YwqG